MPTPTRALRGQAVPLAALVFSASDECPVPAGYVGYWFDGATVFKRNADGSDTPQGTSASAPIFGAVTRTASPLPACTYDNGPNDDGLGATLTADANGALGALSGVSLVAGAGTPVLVDTQASPAENGLYLPTAVGGASATWVLTRLPGFSAAGEIVDGALVTVQQGTFAGRVYSQTATVATVGTDPVTFAEQSNVVLLDATQLVTGPKTFAHGALKQQNAGGTASTTLASAAAQARTWTLPDETGTAASQAYAQSQASAAQAAAIGAAFNADQTIAAPGAQAMSAARTTHFDLAAAANNIAASLPNGTFTGQRKTAVLDTISGGKSVVITPVTAAGFVTATLAVARDGIEFEWQPGGWKVVGISGAPVIA